MEIEPKVHEDDTGRITLLCNRHFMLSPTEFVEGDRVIAEYSNGISEDFAVISESGRPRAKLLTETLDVGGTFYSFQDVDAATEKRLLALHKLAVNKAA
jgi:hypothetical protein